MGWSYPIEVRERMLQLKQEGKTNKEISEIVGLEAKKVGWFLGNHARSEREKALNRPKLKRGRKPKPPEATRKELEKIIKAQEKLIKLYEDFLHLSGRM